MPENKLYAHVVLDRSGSMETCLESTIGAFNEYVGSLRASGMPARLSLTLFDDVGIDLVHDRLDAAAVPELTRRVFVPRGMTPLNDAIGRVVARIDGEGPREGERVALVILTDGLENASREYTKEAVAKLLEARQRDRNWLVLYLGANQDAWAEGAARGMAAATVLDYDTANVASAMAAAARSTVAFAASGSAAEAAFTPAERASARKR